MFSPEKIRNISIIAHIDHGKTTLTDRILELTNSVEARLMKEQFLDSMDLERERGITIKAHPVTVRYTAKDGNTYEINIIDTPGHVDFSYEVSRSLAACEGALLVVDSTQGVEAQTVANAYLAINNDLEIIPIINKIDLANANIEETRREIEDLLGLDGSDCLLASGKTGQGLPEILEAIVHEIPSPEKKIGDRLEALIFDAHYDKYQGVVVHVRVFSGSVKPGDKIVLMNLGEVLEVSQVGVFSPKMTPTKALSAGNVGYIIAGMKEVRQARVGDTLTSASEPALKPLPGYQEAKPMVFAGMYPGTPEYYEDLRKALEKLKLNDAALVFEPDNSPALGFGFRCGFLGLLHMDIVKERLEREFEMTVILTAPNVILRIAGPDGKQEEVTNPTRFPDDALEVYEPYVRLSIITPVEYMGNLGGFIQQERRGLFHHMENAGKDRIMISYDVPLSELIFDFFDKLKAKTRGFGSMDYEFLEYRKTRMAKLSIILNREPVDALTTVVHESKKEYYARELALKLKNLIPKHQFEIPIQIKSGSRIIARETIKALRKDVIAKCYGGDVTRKMKLLDRQKEGKRKMRDIGSVKVPQEAFLAILRVGEEE
ncbi:MAG TPA: translation elongation factor 4 [Thermotogota bacterium]|nr:translation elongation factor 4 [Thermotogota bacterium]NLH19961.1 elongation factor 4 [Thermotogaceae bacterium]OQC30528.1 MAG: Elongation factor 4 [Thermotogota bacterium ADurb.Bin062]HNW47073.1 translation elongation factor 4 [Thermotogota bacterium]HNY82154.1 translation elongation factor 4 [Thermotogota bacterium]